MLIPSLLARGTIHENAITSCGKEIDNVSFVYSMLRAIKGEFSKDRMKSEINAKIRKREEESGQTQSDYSLETHVVDEGDAGEAAVLVDIVLDGWNNDLLTNNSDEVISDEGSASMIQQVSHCKRKLETSSCGKRLRQVKSNVSTITGKFHIYASQC